jgi:hypothetical protein
MKPMPVACLALVASLIALDLAAAGSTPADERWLEVIEQYELPVDPDWRETATAVGVRFGLNSTTRGSEGKAKGRSSDAVRRPGGLLGGESGDALGRFRAATGSFEVWGDFRKRLEQAGENERSREAVFTAIEREVERIVKSADSERKLTVVRAWDGIKREAVCLVLGERQKSILAKCKPGGGLLVELAASNCADHYQSNDRPTILEAKSKPLPSEFLKAVEGDSDLAELRFGSVECPGSWTGTAKKSSKVGSGEIAIEFELPAGSVLDPGSPWYCQFKLLQLDSAGKPSVEVRFTGNVHAVCVSTQTKREVMGGFSGGRSGEVGPEPAKPAYSAFAKGHVEVASPSPYGYIAVATHAWGVRRQASAGGAPTTAPQTP